ncbi:hypothetical protein ACJMK2_022994 [Sinanodonta woodiana]|uniref:Tc1-like transposase DDE domain-containing protein n=1 Tax=Sinanodonta woodiana TaxID=1069815 RepID=A0ABD3TNK3_SINWO
MLTTEEESSIVNYIKYSAQHGFPLTRQYVITIIKQNGRHSLFNINKDPSDKWFQFLPQDRGRNRMLNINVMNQYFIILENTLHRFGSENKPDQIFNCDETNFRCDETNFSEKEKSIQRVIGIKDQHSYQQPHNRVTSQLIYAYLQVEKFFHYFLYLRDFYPIWLIR